MAPVVEVARLLHDDVAQPYMDPVPEEWLHLTLTDVCGVAEMSDDAVAGLVSKVARSVSRRRPIEVRLGPAFMGAEGVLLGAARADEFESLREAVRGAQRKVAAPAPAPSPGPMFAHVSLGYTHAVGDSSDLVMRLSGREGETAVPVTVSGLLLVRQRREPPAYTWTVHERIAFSG
jgi:2'-5' RNA ligase